MFAESKASKPEDQIIGNRTRVKIVKNKVAPPFKQAELDIMYGRGISREGDTLDCAVEHKIVDKAGAWYSFEGNRIGQGRENVKKYLAENPDVLNRIESLLKESLQEKEKEEDGKKEGASPAAGNSETAGTVKDISEAAGADDDSDVDSGRICRRYRSADRRNSFLIFPCACERSDRFSFRQQNRDCGMQRILELRHICTFVFIFR